MADRDRLGALQVGVAGDDGLRAGVRAVEQSKLEAGDRPGEQIDFGAAVESGVGGDLIVALARGVEFRASGTNAFGQLRLDVHVDVLERGLELKVAGLDIVPDGQ